MPASGLVAPLRTFVAVRAIAPVAAKPPNTGASTFATPCPISSWFGLCRVPVMPSATTAVSSDSMAPSSAIANAGPTSWMTSVNPISGHWSEGSVRGMPPNAVPIVATPGNCQAACTAVAASIATSGAGMRPRPGMRSSSAVAGHDDREREDRDAGGRGMQVRQRLRQRPELLVEMGVGARPAAGRRSTATGPTKMMTAMPEVKPTMTGFGMKRMTLPSCRKPMTSSITPAIKRRRLQARDAVLRGDAGEHRDEGAGRPGDLHARAAEDRGRKPGDDRGVEALLRLRAGSDRERHRERQRDDADDDARDDVSPDFAPAKQPRLAGFQ